MRSMIAPPRRRPARWYGAGRAIPTRMTMEITALAKACGKSSVHNLGKEDLQTLSLEASAYAGVKIAGIDRVFSR